MKFFKIMILLIFIVFTARANFVVFKDDFQYDAIESNGEGMFFASHRGSVYKDPLGTCTKVFDTVNYDEYYKIESIQCLNGLVYLECSYGGFFYFYVGRTLFASDNWGQTWNKAIDIYSDEWPSEQNISSVTQFDAKYYAHTLKIDQIQTLVSDTTGFNFVPTYDMSNYISTTDFSTNNGDIYFGFTRTPGQCGVFKQWLWGWETYELPFAVTKFNAMFSDDLSVKALLDIDDTNKSSLYRMESIDDWVLLYDFQGLNHPTFQSTIRESHYFTIPTEHGIEILVNTIGSVDHLGILPREETCSKIVLYNNNLYIAAGGKLYIYSEDPSSNCDLSFDNPGDDPFRPYDAFFLNAKLFNKKGEPIKGATLFIALEAYGEYFFAPSWSQSLDGFSWVFPSGETIVQVLPPFRWPGGVGTGEAMFIGLLFKDEIYSNIATWSFDWGE